MEDNNTILRDKIKREIARIMESTTFSSKGHFNTAPFWKWWYYGLGFATIALSAVVTYSDSILTEYPVATICGFILTIIAAANTLLNPSSNHSEELRVGNEYKTISEKARFLYDIKSLILNDKELLEELECLMVEKAQLDASSSQVPYRYYKKAKKGIEENGESDFKVDDGKDVAWNYSKKKES